MVKNFTNSWLFVNPAEISILTNTNDRLIFQAYLMHPVQKYIYTCMCALIRYIQLDVIERILINLMKILN